MTTLAIIIALLLVAGAIVYLLLEKRPGYGAWYGLAKLTGSRLDIGPVDWATLTRHATPNDALVCPAGALSERQARLGAEDSTRCRPAELLARLRTVALAEPDTLRAAVRAASRPHRALRAAHAADALSRHDRCRGASGRRRTDRRSRSIRAA